MKTSCVIPKIVGIESTANTISVLANTTTTKNIGVKTFTPSTVVLNLDPSKSLLIFINLLDILKKKLFSGLESSSFTKAIFTPVYKRNNPIINITQLKLASIIDPRAINIALVIRAPIIPYVNARDCSFSGI